MIAQLVTDQQFANSSRSDASLADIPSIAIVCPVNTDPLESSSGDFGSIDVSILLNHSAQNEIKPPTTDIEEWTPAMEAKFRRLAEAKAFGNLSLKGRVEFERYMALRRQLKNPRTGEDVLIEYQQRMLTRKLVNVLTEYVNFHKLPHQTGKAP